LSELKELKVRAKRLRASLDRASSPDEIIRIQEQLNELKRKIRALEG
jgi:hypothetical protein